MSSKRQNYVRAASLAALQEAGCLSAQVDGHTLALFAYGDNVYAVDNRCPHMGFPLDRGTVRDGILTCHWHHARFDLASGGTFDQFADDVRTFPVEIRDGEIWVDTAPHGDPRGHHKERLQVGLERDISLVVAKAVITLLDNEGDPVEPFRIGLDFGTRYRNAGWGQGLTIHTCMMNLLPYLDTEDRPRALYHGLSAVAADTFGRAPRFMVRPLPDNAASIETLKAWFRQFIEVRDDEGAERCIISAIRAGASPKQLADMLFAALPEAIQRGLEFEHTWNGRPQLVETLLADNPQATANALLDALRQGANMVEVASAVTYAAALRIARFHTSNEFGDWDTALHTFTFANAIEQGLRRAPSAELLRGVFDAAMSVYLDRFLNIPAARLPLPPSSLSPHSSVLSPALATQKTAAAALNELHALLDRQQQVNQAGDTAAHYLFAGGNPADLLALLGKLLLREDRDFHTIQTVEAAFRQYQLLQDAPGNAGVNVLVAAARYLAAHSPTVRAQGQTYQIASRLHRGDRLFEG